ncbi:MAG: transketolase [Desulfuromonadaceae bacterium]|nr:transketolase [Desulfuromonadaceae bacterium]MDD2849254.1 transketolase [Desulfuromonadaceae bacterium]MDD4131881.1 transketolase [Desulfuromonadaceae bacterium]
MNNGSPRTFSSSGLDQLCINTIRFLSIDAVQKATSGHPGMPMGAAPMAYMLWDRFLNHNPANHDWFNRDRFVLSAGHASMLLYSLLHLSGYDLSLDEIKRFRQWQSKTPGHPERGHTPGVEITTGPLGQGFANGVGMAMAEAHLAARYNRPGFDIIDHFTYVIASDGDLMEGVTAEAASLAGHLRLGKLICLYDDNRITLAAATDLTFTEDRAQRFAAYGWHVQTVSDGNDLGALHDAINTARSTADKPSIIIVRTHIGFGSPHKHDSFEAHGSPLGEDEVRLTKENLGWPTKANFIIPEEALHHFRQALPRGKEAEEKWDAMLSAYAREYSELAHELRQAIDGCLPADWAADIPSFPADQKGMASRVAAGKVMNAIAPRLPWFVGGSADLDPSTHTALKGLGDFQSPNQLSGDRQGAVGGEWGYSGRNFHFGIREHAMAAAMNGMAAHGGLIPFGATFFTFSDYLRPSLRLAALMGLHVIHVFTHDSIALGEDGPTHQPVEQLASLRAIPDLLVIRPGDANETAVAWQVALEQAGPVALVFSRQNIPTLDRMCYAPAEGLRHGAYVVAQSAGGMSELILIATGSELHLALAAQDELALQNVHASVVSMPCWELFDMQPQEYRDSVLPPQVTKRLAIEAGSPLGWHKYVGTAGDILAVEQFGASAPGEIVLREYGFTVENVCRKALALLADHVETNR